jgi:hypothetical protein
MDKNGNKLIDEYICKKCNKKYSDRTGLWKHNNKYHSTENNPNVIQPSSNVEVENKYFCDYCNKEFKFRQGKWKHQQKCQSKNEILQLKLQIQDLTKKLEKIKNKPVKKVINYNGPINNGNILANNNNFSLCQPGDENIKLLTLIEKKQIMSEGMNSIVKLVDKLNFNERIPEHHNFYVSALNDKHVNTYDKETNSIVKKSKKDFYDHILNKFMIKLEGLANENKYNEFNNAFDKLKKFIFLRKGRQEFFVQINMLGFNKKHLVISTWEKLINDDNIKSDEFDKQIENNMKQFIEMSNVETIKNSWSKSILDFTRSDSSDYESYFEDSDYIDV